MDEKDLRILKTIGELATTSQKQIQEELDMAGSTVHYRLNKLRDSGLLQDDLFNIDLKKLGLEITVVSDVFADYQEGYHDEVGEQLMTIEGVEQVYFMMGDTDFMVVAHLSNRGMVERLITDYEKIDSVERTSSQFVIKTVKKSSRPIQNYSLDTLRRIHDFD